MTENRPTLVRFGFVPDQFIPFALLNIAAWEKIEMNDKIVVPLISSQQTTVRSTKDSK